jgi:hypothetical protein
LDDYNHIKRVLLDGCPAQFTFEEPSSNKLGFISQGNSKSFVDNPALVKKIMNRKIATATWFQWTSSFVNYHHIYNILHRVSLLRRARATV